MRTATLSINGLTPYSQSRAIQSSKEEKETYEQFDARIWPEHIHVDDDGQPIIPASGLLQCIAAGAAYLSKGGQLKKKGMATWSENFLCGLAIARSPELVTPHEARAAKIYCHADGRRGSGKRVWRTFPQWDTWSAVVIIHILDDSIPDEVFEQVVEAAGLFKGLGRFRPENGGYLGRFTVTKVNIVSV